MKIRGGQRNTISCLDGFPPLPVRSASSLAGGVAIPEPSQLSDRESYASESGSRELENFQRLEHLVRTLLQRYQALQTETVDLRAQLEEREARVEEREARVRTLEGQILELNQTRRDAAKRLDDLIAQLDHLDAKLGGGDKTPSGPSAD